MSTRVAPCLKKQRNLIFDAIMFEDPSILKHPVQVLRKSSDRDQSRKYVKIT